jgi:hypothetical protein
MSDIDGVHLVLTGKAAGTQQRVRGPSDTEYMHAIDTDDAQR